MRGKLLPSIVWIPISAAILNAIYLYQLQKRVPFKDFGCFGILLLFWFMISLFVGAKKLMQLLESDKELTMKRALAMSIFILLSPITSIIIIIQIYKKYVKLIKTHQWEKIINEERLESNSESQQKVDEDD